MMLNCVPIEDHIYTPNTFHPEPMHVLNYDRLATGHRGPNEMLAHTKIGYPDILTESNFCLLYTSDAADD